MRVLVHVFPEGWALGEEAIQVGAIGVVYKSNSTAFLVRAIREAAGLESAYGVSAGPRSGAPPPRAPRGEIGEGVRLSRREVEVLALYAAGEKAYGVARKLGVARETVVDYVRRIRAKYKAVGRPAPTKIDLYKRAVEDGIIQSQE